MPLTQFSDYPALVGYISNGDNSDNQEEVGRFFRWCKEAQLILNVDKTKELIVVFRKKKQRLHPYQLKEVVEVVPSRAANLPV